MTATAVSIGRAAPIRAKLGTTGTTPVYTCQANQSARVIGMRCVNTSVGPVSIIVTIIDLTAVTYTFYPSTLLAAGAVIDFDLVSHPLKPTETLNVQASVANTIQVVGTVLELSV